MMLAMLIAGIGLLLAGLLGIVFGIPVKEFSFGNTLIITGVIGACTGAIMLGLGTVVAELRNISRRLGSQASSISPSAVPQTSDQGGFPFGRDQLAPETAGDATTPVQSPPPWQGEAVPHDRGRDDAPAAVPEPVEPAPAGKSRRNLLFSSSSRKERERAQARSADPLGNDPRSTPSGPAFPVAPPAVESNDLPVATFDDAWPKSERAKVADSLPSRRSTRSPTQPETTAAATTDRYPPVARADAQPPVTVLKSGVVDGMAYSLYSDGSIEAQMPEGMMRFASIDELRSHLEQRP